MLIFRDLWHVHVNSKFAKGLIIQQLNGHTWHCLGANFRRLLILPNQFVTSECYLAKGRKTLELEISYRWLNGNAKRLTMNAVALWWRGIDNRMNILTEKKIDATLLNTTFSDDILKGQQRSEFKYVSKNMYSTFLKCNFGGETRWRHYYETTNLFCCSNSFKYLWMVSFNIDKLFKPHTSILQFNTWVLIGW